MNDLIPTEEERIRKTFRLKLNGKEAFELEIEGSKSLVEQFSSKTMNDGLTGYKAQQFFGDFFINGVKSQYQLIQRDEKGHFKKPNLSK